MSSHPSLALAELAEQKLDLALFFQVLRVLGPLRILSVCGPSVFEAITEVGPFGVAEGYLNVMTGEYHWHLEVARCRHLRSHDGVHARSGRRVLFFELRETPEAKPFLVLYLHRAKGEEFDATREQTFAALHQRAAAGLTFEVTP